MLGVLTSIANANDPATSDNFCFLKRVAKDAELFHFDAVGNAG